MTEKAFNCEIFFTVYPKKRFIFLLRAFKL